MTFAATSLTHDAMTRSSGPLRYGGGPEHISLTGRGVEQAIGGCAYYEESSGTSPPRLTALASHGI